MENLDNLLARIESAPLPARLSAIDQAVFTGLADHQRNTGSSSYRSLSVAAVAALAIGAFSVSAPLTPAAASSLVFGVPSALAPSSLLLGAK